MEPKFDASTQHLNQVQASSDYGANQNGGSEKGPEDSHKHARTEEHSLESSPEKTDEKNMSYQISVQNFGPLDTQITDNKPPSKQEATNRLFVEMELGQQSMPKPLLSGYFTNHLNSVQNVNEA